MNDARFRSLIPAEHGGYGMLLFPITSALLVTGFVTPAVLLALAFVLTFLSHRAFLVASGLRPAAGARSTAGWILVATGGMSVLLTLAAVAVAPFATRWALLASAPGGFAFLRVLMRHAERTASGELLASLVLSSCSIPVALAGGADLQGALAIGWVWIAGFAATSLAIRSVIERGRPARASRFRGIAIVMAAAGIALMAALAAAGKVPGVAPVAQLPLCGLACALAVRPCDPRRMKSLGWLLMTASLLTLGQLVLLVK